MSADAVIIEWRPGTRSVLWWTPLSFLIAIAGLVIFALPLGVRTGRVELTIQPFDVVVLLAFVVALVVAHEGIHALAMSVLGARPEFGVVVLGKVMPALYTTAPGHRFSRGQYLTVALSPAVALSLVGFVGCLTPLAGYLVVPLAVHLAGCTGDAVASWRVLREPRGTTCEDLRDGIRFYRAAPITPA